MALPASAAFKEAMKAPVKQLRTTITLTSGDISHTYSGSDSLQRLNITESGSYFNAATAALDFALIGTAYEYLGYIVTVTLAVATNAAATTWESLEVGKFKISEQKVDLEKGITTFKGFDVIGYLGSKEYVSGVIDYPITVAELASAVVTNTSVGLSTDLSTFPNGNYSIKEDLYAKISGTSYRDILGEIAGATASICGALDGTGSVVFKPIDMTPIEAIGYENLRSIKLKDKYGKVNTLVLSRQPQEDNIVVTDEEMAAQPAGKNIVDISKLSIGGMDRGVASTLKYRINNANNPYAVEPNTTYTLSVWLNGEAKGFRIGVHTCDIDGKFLADSGWKQLATASYTFTTSSDTHYVKIVCSLSTTSNNVTTGGTESTVNYTDVSEWLRGATIQLEKGGSKTSYEPFEAIGAKEVKLANNEILDDDRETLITPIFNATKGLWYYPFEAVTEGHGWHKVGDRLKVYAQDPAAPVAEVVITEVKLSLTGGISETIKGEALTETKTNYAIAGGITKSIYNTEIKVDKQNQEITSVVSRVDQLGQETAENFTQVSQQIDNLTASVQETGGGNLILNSVGYDTAADGSLVDWTTVGTAKSLTSPESLSYGAISGNQISLNASSSITQRIAVDGVGGQKYNLAFKAKKGATGTITATLTNNIDRYVITVPAGKAALWETFELTNITASENYFDVKITTDANATDAAITDLMFNVGDTMQWVQASSEILNTQVAVTRNGVKVKSSVYSGDYVEITPLGFNGYSTASGSSQTVFTLNRDTTMVQQLRAERQIEMPPIKIVPITSGSRAGWAFVKMEDN